MRFLAGRLLSLLATQEENVGESFLLNPFQLPVTGSASGPEIPVTFTFAPGLTGTSYSGRFISISLKST